MEIYFPSHAFQIKIVFFIGFSVNHRLLKIPIDTKYRIMDRHLDERCNVSCYAELDPC